MVGTSVVAAISTRSPDARMPWASEPPARTAQADGDKLATGDATAQQAQPPPSLGGHAIERRDPVRRLGGKGQSLGALGARQSATNRKGATADMDVAATLTLYVAENCLDRRD